MILFLNKNQYRKYPFTKDASLGALDDSAIVAMRINQCYGSFDRFYIKQISVQDGVFTATLYGVTPAPVDVFIGSFSAKINKNFQVVPIYSVSPVFASGTLTIGSTDAFVNNFAANYDQSTGAVEPTCVGYYERPGVYSITVYPHTYATIPNIGKSLTGHVKLIVDGVRTNAKYTTTTGLTGGAQQGDATSLVYATATTTILTEALVATRVAAKLKQSLCAGDCLSPIIYSVNGVTPDINGNITILATAPLSVTVNSVLGVIGISSSFNRTTLCAGVMPNKAPYLASSNYYTNLAIATDTEWHSTWPQYTT